MIRMCYYEHPDYVPLLRRAYELWRELETTSGERVLHVTGGLYMGRPDSEAVAGSQRAAVEHGLPHEMLSRGELGRRYPQFVVPEDFVGMVEPAAGWLPPEQAVAAAARLAVERGAMIRTGERVVEWGADSSEVMVRTEVGEYRARRLIIAAGAWAGKVVRDLGVPITATRQVLGWFRPRTPGMFAAGVLPVWAMQSTEEFGGDLFYGFPMSGEGVLGQGFKLARHAPGVVADPDNLDRAARAEDEQDIRPFLSRFIPEASGELMETRVCMYENSPDQHFIIDRHPKHENVIVAAGFSGHGFKFASVVGEVLADLAMDGATRHPIGFLGLSRFLKPGTQAT
jgi:sarcosine oxidase